MNNGRRGSLLAGPPAWTWGRVAWMTLGGAAAGTILAASLLSPLALAMFASAYDVDWEGMSEVGQAYNAASAILAALALFGVSISLLLQARQVRSQRVQIVRELHFELTKIALDDPEVYLPCWRPIPVETLDQKRQHVYENLVFSYFWMLSELIGLPEDQLGRIAAGHFRGEAGIRYWKAVKEDGWMPTFAANSSQRRRLRFERILNAEYKLAQRSEEPRQPDRFEFERRPPDDRDPGSAPRCACGRTTTADGSGPKQAVVDLQKPTQARVDESSGDDADPSAREPGSAADAAS